MAPNSDSEREQASILTNAQREYLRGEREVTDSAEREYRTRIRRRVTAGVHDLRLLLEKLESRDLKRALEGTPTDEAIAFLIRRSIPSPADSGEREASEGDTIQFIAHIFERAINRAAEVEGHNRRYEVSVKPRKTDDRSAIELELELRRGDMTLEDLQGLYEGGLISWDTYQEVRTNYEGDEGDTGEANEGAPPAAP